MPRRETRGGGGSKTRGEMARLQRRWTGDETVEETPARGEGRPCQCPGRSLPGGHSGKGRGPEVQVCLSCEKGSEAAHVAGATQAGGREQMKPEGRGTRSQGGTWSLKPWLCSGRFQPRFQDLTKGRPFSQLEAGRTPVPVLRLNVRRRTL